MSKLIKLQEECLFTAGRAATEWDEDGAPIGWSEWSEEDLRKMVENDHAIRETNQAVPYINPAHFEDPVPGFVGPLRFEAGDGKRAARVHASVTAEPWIARQVQGGQRPWRSVEITKHAQAADYHGIEGPVLRGLALLNTHPRRKNLDSPVYAENNISFFEEPASAGSVYVTPYQEPRVMDIAKIMAALEALDGDTAKLAAVAEALGIASEVPAVVAAETAPEALASDKVDEETVEALAAMSESLAQAKADAAQARQATEASLVRERERKIAEFREALVEGYGEARAEAAVRSVRSRVEAQPVSEVFSESNVALTDTIFSDQLASMGQPTVAAMTVSAGATKAQKTAKVENFSDAARSVLSDATDGEGRVLRNPAFEGALTYLANQRLVAARS